MHCEGADQTERARVKFGRTKREFLSETKDENELLSSLRTFMQIPKVSSSKNQV